MRDIRPSIDALRSLDLSKRPYDEVKALLQQFGNVAAVKLTLHPGSIIMRGRPNNGEHFSRLSQVSYKPSEFNTTFQRASTPNNTMFYGGHIHEDVQLGELDATRIIPLFESMPLIRDPNSSGEALITYSKWRVTQDIPLISIIHYKDFQRGNSYAEQQRIDFDKFVSTLNEPLKANTIVATDLIATEFAKVVTPNDYDYIISATYTELIALNSHAAGVYYPSVRTGGEGFNVAIHPDYVNNNMVLEAVGECTIYKKEKKTIVDNETIAIILGGQTEFELKPVLPQYHEGRDKILKMLNA